MKLNELYDEYRDPSDEFRKKEVRAFIFDLGLDLIKIARQEAEQNWLASEKVIHAIVMLLYCWNFAAPKTKKLCASKISILLTGTKESILLLSNTTLISCDFDAKGDCIEGLFNQCQEIFDQTGATKALALLNPSLFVMWDTKIRDKLRVKYEMKGIDKGRTGSNYVAFLKALQCQVKTHQALKDVEPIKLAKKLDEYHYIKLVKP